MATVEEERLKERRDLGRDRIEQATEDVGLSRAIAEGTNSGPISRDQIFALLDDSVLGTAPKSRIHPEVERISGLVPADVEAEEAYIGHVLEKHR